MRIFYLLSTLSLLVACSDSEMVSDCTSVCDVITGNCHTLNLNDTIYIKNPVYGIDVKDSKGKRLGRLLYRDSIVNQLNKEINLYDVSGNRELITGRKIFSQNCLTCHTSPKNPMNIELIEGDVEFITCNNVELFYSEKGKEHWPEKLLSVRNRDPLKACLSHQQMIKN